MNEPSTKLGKIFIGGLSYETTDGESSTVWQLAAFIHQPSDFLPVFVDVLLLTSDKLRSYFSAFGPVTDAVVMKDPISRRSRGFGFITYADPVCVDRALAQPNHILDSRRVEAKRAVPRAESTSRDSFSSTSSRNGSIISTTSVSSNAGSTKKIFVGGLHYETKDAEFRRYFQQFGKVVSAEVMFNRETNKSRGFGFVIFELEESVELVLQENNHVIDGKSVEVKRAVPRTDVPPSRSVSSRAGSFCGTAGPGSVGSLDDVSVTSTASISRSGTPSNLESRYNTQPANGALVGYAAAVRFGGRGASRTGSLHQPSPLHDVSNLDNPEKTLARVADRLTSLVLDDDVMTTSLSSSRGSDKVLESPVAPLLSPLGIAPRPLTDPVLDTWNLSPARAPQSSLDVPLLSPTEAGAPWQARPWQKGWASQAEREDRAARDHHQQDPHTTPSYFSAFAGDRRGSSTPLGHNAWSSPSYAQSNAGTIGSEGNGSVFESSGHSSNGAFGGVGIATMGPRSPYSSLGGFLPNQFLSQTEPELPLDAAFGGVMEDLADEKLTMPLQFEQQYT